ncbi:MAG: PQQ-binding-like beta-propeller repeat protein [Phycisphaerae bacterium]
MQIFTKIHAIRSLAALSMIGFIATAEESWPGWGGPQGDFAVPGAIITDSFPADGPKKLWSRELTGGYSSIAANDGIAIVLGRSDDEEIVLALDLATGKTKWEYKYAAPVPKTELTEEQKNDPNRQPGEKEYIADFGFGPNATPLIADNRIVSIGYMGDMHCFDRDGQVRWKHDFIDDYGMKFLRFGYSASPIHYKDTVIALVGGEGHSVVAFDLASGDVRWHKHDWAASYGSPAIFNIDGRDVLVSLVDGQVIALNPADGELLWSMDYSNQYGSYIATPIACGNNTIYIGTAGKDGSVLLDFTWQGDKLDAKQVWTSKHSMAHQNAVRLDGHLLTSRMQPKSLVMLNLSDGEFGWYSRDMGFCNLVRAGEKIISLQDDGVLRILRPKDDGVEVAAEAKLLGDPSWTPPTLVGTTLLIRDRNTVMALDLSAS